MGSPLMSGAEPQEGAGGALRMDGLQDGGRVNNTQLIALFLVHGRGKKYILSPTEAREFRSLQVT